MNEQMTSDGMYVLIGAIVVFWIAVAVLVRLHRGHTSGRPERMS